MTYIHKMEQTTPSLKELLKLVRQSTLLQSESKTQYAKMFRRLASDLKCADYMELLFTKDVLDETWTIIRLRKASNGAITGRAKKQHAMADLRRERQGHEQHKQEVKAEVEKEIKDEKTRTSAFTEMSEYVCTLTTRENGYKQEIHEANALEDSIDYQLKLNILLDAAMKRRNDALKQLEWYRKAFAANVRKTTDAAIEAATADTDTDAGACADTEAEAGTEADNNKVPLAPEG